LYVYISSSFPKLLGTMKSTRAPSHLKRTSLRGGAIQSKKVAVELPLSQGEGCGGRESLKEAWLSRGRFSWFFRGAARSLSGRSRLLRL
jgi:hypothetical protein